MIGSQADYARHAKVSRQAVGKMVATGKIPVRPDGKIDFAEADHARQANSDPARQPMTAEPAPAPAAAPDTGGQSYTDARTERESYQAKMARLDYEKQLGLVIPKQDVANALEACGRAIRADLDGLVGMAEDMTAAAKAGGVESVRALLKERVRELQAGLEKRLTGMASDNDGEDE